MLAPQPLFSNMNRPTHASLGILTRSLNSEASTIPLAAISSSYALYRVLALPAPWAPVHSTTTTPTPLVINGASTALGAFAIKLASLANIHPILAIAGAGKTYVDATLLDASRGDRCLDYRASSAAEIVEAFKGFGARHAIEAVGDAAGLDLLRRIVAPGGKIALSYPAPPVAEDVEEYKSGVVDELILSVAVHESLMPAPKGGKAFGAVMCRYFAHALADGSFTGHPYKVVDGGLDGVLTALQDLKAGKASACKFVTRVV